MSVLDDFVRIPADHQKENGSFRQAGLKVHIRLPVKFQSKTSPVAKIVLLVLIGDLLA